MDLFRVVRYCIIAVHKSLLHKQRGIIYKLLILCACFFVYSIYVVSESGEAANSYWVIGSHASSCERAAAASAVAASHHKKSNDILAIVHRLLSISKRFNGKSVSKNRVILY